MSEDFEALLLDRFDKAVDSTKKKIWKVVAWVLSIFGVLILGVIFQSGVMYATVKNIEHTVNSHIESEASTVRSIEENVDDLKEMIITNQLEIAILKAKEDGKGKD